MAEYIEREALFRSIADDVAPFNVAMVFRHIRNAPAADVAPVVRCKDCAYSYEDIGGRTCSHGVCVDCIVPDDFCCAYGKREENNNEAGN